jgi:RNA polymerase sigma factor (sigma-70 family)
VQVLRKTALYNEAGGLSDGQLLDSFVRCRDEAGFAALVRRHGTVVWGVCRRILSHHDAEDAFQATFLVLARKAASVRRRETVVNWLYGVACRTAWAARRTNFRRAAREKQAKDMPHPSAPFQEAWQELRSVLDKELFALPDKLRWPVILCDLEGKTGKQAARQLRIPEGTLASRLRTARTMLAKRLTDHGITLSAGALVAVLAQNVASACPRAAVVSSTIKAAPLFAAGQAAAATIISANVAVLTEGVMHTMWLMKLKAVVAVAVVMSFVATGVTVLTCRTVVGQNNKSATAEKPVEASAGSKQDPEKRKATLDKALDIAKAMEVTDEGQKILLLASIGAAQARAGDKKGASKTLQLALALVEHVGVRDGVRKCYALSAIAFSQIVAEDLDGARKTLAAVKELQKTSALEEMRLEAGLAVTVNEVQIAAAQARGGDIKGALKTAQEIDDHRRVHAYGLIALEQAKRKDFSGALATLARADSIRKAEMLMEVAKIQEITDKTGAARTWKLVLDALTKLEVTEEAELNRGGIKFEAVIGALVERGHGDVVQRWIDGLPSPAVQIRLLLVFAGQK